MILTLYKWPFHSLHQESTLWWCIYVPFGVLFYEVQYVVGWVFISDKSICKLIYSWKIVWKKLQNCANFEKWKLAPKVVLGNQNFILAGTSMYYFSAPLSLSRIPGRKSGKKIDDCWWYIAPNNVVSKLLQIKYTLGKNIHHNDV